PGEIGLLPDSDDHRVACDRLLRVRNRYWGAPSARIRWTELHRFDDDAIDVTLADDADRGLLEDESDPFLFRTMDLLGVRRHFSPATSIDQRNFATGETERAADRIH